MSHQQPGVVHPESVAIPTYYTTLDFIGALISALHQRRDEVIEIEEHEFLMDSAVSIAVTRSPEAVIEHAEMATNERYVSATVSGYIMDKESRTQLFSFSYSIIQEDCVHDLIVHNFQGYPGTISFSVHVGEEQPLLRNSVLSFDLYSRDHSGRQHKLGHVRGFLIFGGAGKNMIN